MENRGLICRESKLGKIYNIDVGNKFEKQICCTTSHIRKSVRWYVTPCKEIRFILNPIKRQFL